MRRRLRKYLRTIGVVALLASLLFVAALWSRFGFWYARYWALWDGDNPTLVFVRHDDPQPPVTGGFFGRLKKHEMHLLGSLLFQHVLLDSDDYRLSMGTRQFGFCRGLTSTAVWFRVDYTAAAFATLGIALWLSAPYLTCREGCCPNCGYDLRGAVHNRCSECGTACSPP